MTKSLCRFCGSALRRSFVDLGRSPLSNAFLRHGPADGDGAALPAARLCLRRIACWCSCLRSASPGGDLHGLCLFLVVLQQLAESRGSTMRRRMKRRSLPWVPRLTCRGAGKQRRVSAAALPAARASGSRRGTRRQRRSGGRDERCAHRGRVFSGTATARRLAAGGRRADLIVGQQRAGACAGPERLRRRIADPAEARRHASRVEFPHLLRLIAGRQFDTIYHEHFSYFSLFVADRVFAAQGCTCSTSTACRRMAARCASMPATRAPARHARAYCGARRRDHGRADSEPAGYTSFAARRHRRQMPGLLEFLIGARRAGRLGRRIWGACQGDDAAQLLWHRAPSCCLYGRSQPAQARALGPGRQIPILAPERILTDRPDYLFVLPWNLRDEVLDQMHAAARLGRSVRRCDPGVAGPVMRFDALELAGAFMVRPERHADERGWFARTFCARRVHRAQGSPPTSHNAARRSMRAGARCAACTSSAPLLGDKARALHARRGVRCPAGSAPSLPDVPLLARRRVERGERCCRLKPPLISHTGPKTSVKRGCSCSMKEKRCISGPSQSSDMFGIRS